ncbi:Dad4p ASCRUDRAFT_76411 [Ascoidea rubescens DSM 1968]|uniref:Uncharacterized protein n=1 Tax=Ascoidea rubescens DSM 1968 TaxID=1344418 RepID=A0A1D2VFI1_9ASCO|nr:hypothetical protein ASCRUDRAFT_76411 [Ascoidea rubescens DSM 1968]ODV60421.1 hypothetical protein ASCRUDRAFT_76411 [Ascoidea rubescens DSM 1968]
MNTVVCYNYLQVPSFFALDLEETNNQSLQTRLNESMGIVNQCLQSIAEQNNEIDALSRILTNYQATAEDKLKGDNNFKDPI